MVWRGPTTPRDPVYTTKQWRDNRAYWKRLELPCALCGRPINYEAPYLLPNGKVNPWAYALDHIVPVAVARERGLTELQINALSNCRPTHRKCNGSSGAKLGQRRRNVKTRRRKVAFISTRW